MNKVTFNKTTTSALGFGCSSLTNHFSKRNAVETLEYCFDNGITHFDTARAYGFGMAEKIMSDFISGKRDKITITSKFGLKAKPAPLDNLFMLNSARMLMNLSSNIKGGIVNASGGVNQKVSINAVACEISLTETLRNMQTDYIDFFLLHECSMEEAHREDMLSFLASAVKAGKIRHIGLATNFTNLPRNLSILDPIYEVVQYNDDRISNHTSQLIGCENKLLIHFNIISSSIKSNGKIPVNELLSWSKTNNPNGICLFTSTKKANIQTNVKCWCN